MKILLIGNGAREHVIAETLKRNKSAILYSYLKSKNPGIISLSEDFEVGLYTDLGKVKAFARKVKPDFGFVGPDDPLSYGVVDALNEAGIEAVGPNKSLARLETSKSFTRNLLRKYKIDGNPKFEIFNKSNIGNADKFIDDLEQCVVKPDGLTGGKGVKVQGDHFTTKEEALEYCNEVLQTHPFVIVEEKLEGEEFSLQCLTDGKTVIATPPVQDHKRAFVDDKGPNCYSEDTEILTEGGWKTFDKVNENDKVAAFDHKNKNFWFEKPKKIYWIKHDGEMINFKHRYIDLFVTPNHRMLLEKRKYSKRIFVCEAKDVCGENYIYQTANWSGVEHKHVQIPEYDYKFNRKLKQIKIKYRNWVKFMGIYLSEGYVNLRDKKVCICQTKNSKYFLQFKNILNSLGLRYTYEEKNNRFRINSVQLAKTLAKYGKAKDKYVPSYIKDSSKRIIKEFLEAYLIGDGDVHYGKMRFHSSSKRMIDDLQELILKIGKNGIISKDKRISMLNPINQKHYKASPVYSIEVLNRTKTSIRKSNIKTVKYIGYVGCVAVSTGFVIVRRNGRIAVSGNTGGMGSYSCENHLLPFMAKKDAEEGLKITQKVAEAIHKETGEYYKGIMYGGFIVTKDGIKLLEYNARFGDPEAMNVLPLLENDFVEVCNAIINQQLHKMKIKFQRMATVCKYVVPEGYPDNPVKNEKIEIGKIPQDARLYYGSVDKREDGLYITSSRAIGCVGIADSLDEAEKIAEEATKSVKGKVFHREDIGTKKLIERRVMHMKEILR